MEIILFSTNRSVDILPLWIGRWIFLIKLWISSAVKASTP